MSVLTFDCKYSITSKNRKVAFKNRFWFYWYYVILSNQSYFVLWIMNMKKLAFKEIVIKVDGNKSAHPFNTTATHINAQYRSSPIQHDADESFLTKKENSTLFCILRFRPQCNGSRKSLFSAWFEREYSWSHHESVMLTTLQPRQTAKLAAVCQSC